MGNLNNKVNLAQCPTCESALRFHQSLLLGQIISCPECDESLEVRSLSPLSLGWAYEKYDDDEQRQYWPDER